MPELTVDNARFRHFRSVRWILPGGPLRAEAYHPVVEGDECPGCLVCERTIGWFMEFARIGRELGQSCNFGKPTTRFPKLPVPS